MSKFLLVLFLAGYFLVSNNCQKNGGREDVKNLNLFEAECQSKNKNCSQCIQSGCKWCTDADVDKRCFFDKANVKGYTCQNFEDPSSLVITEMLGQTQGSSVKPSHFHIKLRPGRRHKLNVTMVYKDEENRPLDLYILMDLSCTMAVHKDIVAKLAEDLAKKLRSLTKELRMGFGSFVDKPILPFARENMPLDITCNNKSLPYVKPHLFKNHLSLTSNITEFTRTVNESTIMTNIDVPEGGLDALMQAVVCKNEINWRNGNNTRRLIVLSTDGPFHIAGDGKLGGILLPNDGQCHLNKDREYDKATVLDYPSVSQIRDRIQQNNIFVIFAVTRQHKSLYGRLAQKIGSDLASVSIITEEDSSSVTKVIEQEYQKVVQSVKFQPIPPNPYLEVTYFAKCPGRLDYTKQGGCDNITPNATVEYLVEFSLKACPKNKTLTTTEVEIRPTTSGNENGNFLTVKVDMICECGCEMETDQTPITASCNNKGFEQCGICKCVEDFGGPFCNCSIAGVSQSSVDQESCLFYGEICSNRGSCICGKCECNKGFVGDHCECVEREKCPLAAGDEGVCNKNLGHAESDWCTCKGCNCRKGVLGQRCECPSGEDWQDRCRTSNTAKICNNVGKCECGKCTCDPGSGHHGILCELRVLFETAFPSRCQASFAKLVEPCIKCLTFDNIAINETMRINSCKSQCSSETGGFVKAILHEKIGERLSTECEGKVVDDKNCEVEYIVHGQNVDTKEIQVRVTQRPTCPPEAAIVPIVLSVLGVILLIGIATLLLWKILTHIHDKKEFTRFENERSTAAWLTNQNPLYKETVSEFQNPAYSTEDFSD